MRCWGDILLTGKVAFLLMVFTSGCSILSYGPPNSPEPKHEFRAVWIATVVNIDWPSEKTLTTAEQQREFIDILAFYQELNFNAVVVQVRAAGDAFYSSSYEPWSKYLTGEEGRAPAPYYDPLEWMIAEAHQRGFEFHAWFNPYRATFDKDTLSLAPNHAFNAHRPWVIEYGKRFYFNPGLPEVRRYTTDVIMEVVNRYDIDGVHFDDYFYPYKVKGETFDDSAAFTSYGTGMGLEDWRRANVDSLIKNISDSLRAVKPWVQFGISPFGVWRNASVDSLGSDTRAGQTTYDDLYADPLKWMEYDWIDNVIPQLYWSMDYPPASHRTLIKWWSGQAYQGHLYVGNGIYKVKNNNDKAWRKYREVLDQLTMARNEPAVSGNVFFSARSLRGEHAPLAKKIKRKKYRYPALPPSSPFTEKSTVDRPAIRMANWQAQPVTIHLKPPNEAVRFMLVYGAKKNRKLDVQNPCSIMLKKYIESGPGVIVSLDKKRLKGLGQLAFTFIDKYGKESTPVVLPIGHNVN